MTIAGATFTIRPAPDRDPPFDDELDPGLPDPPGPMQPALPFPPLHPPVRLRGPAPQRSARRAAVGDPERFARRLLLGVVEVASQHRPLAQLGDLVSPRTMLALRDQLAPGRLLNHRLRNGAVSSVHCSEPDDGIAEVCATIRTPCRVRAAALRLEIRRDQWVCTRVMLG